MTFTNALAASLIWGINTLFLLDAGLSSSQAFSANAAYTAGIVPARDAAGVAVFAFYAMQPYLLERYGDADAYWIAGLMAAIIAGSQIAGGLTPGRLARRLRRRTTLPLVASMLGAVLLIGIGLASSVGVVLVMAVGWGLVGATSDPFRRAYLNAMIPSQERATVLSFDSLLSSAGGVFSQPALGRVADVNGYAASFVVGGAVSALAAPFVWFARRLRMDADVMSAPVARL